MKFFAVLLCGFLSVAFSQPKAAPSQIRAVYLFPMANGFDQYLANRLTNLGVYQVVTDPKRADAVFTDRLGEAFESQLAELFPEPEPAPTPAPKEESKPEPGAAKPSAPPEERESAPARQAKPSAQSEERDSAPAQEAKTKEARTVPFTTFGRGKGTLFLVDIRTRAVLWSVYERPKDSSSQELDRTAERIAARLKHEMLKTK